MPPLASTALTASIVLSAFGALIVCLLTFFYGFTADGEEAPARATRRRLLTRVGHAVAAACFAGTAILLTVVLARAVRAVAPSPADARVPALDAKLDAQVLRLQGVEQRMKDSEETLQRLEMEVSEIAARRMAPEAAPAMSEAPKPEAPPRAVSSVKPAARPRAAVVPARPPAKATPPAAKPAERPAPAIAPPPPVVPTERAVAPAPSDEPAASPPAPPVTATPPVTTPPPAPSRPSSSVTPASVAPAVRNVREASNDLRSKLINDWRAIQHGWDSAGDDFRRAIAPLRGEN